jgi:hypothetical protein
VWTARGVGRCTMREATCCRAVVPLDVFGDADYQQTASGLQIVGAEVPSLQSSPDCQLFSTHIRTSADTPLIAWTNPLCAILFSWLDRLTGCEHSRSQFTC